MRFEVTHDRAKIDAVQDHVTAQLQASSFPESSVFAVRLALEEALANAIKHGSSAGEPVHVRVDAEPDELRIVVKDHGPGFDPDAVPDPTAEENLDKPCGRGLLLIRTYMSEVNFNDAGNEITMVYRRPGA